MIKEVTIEKTTYNELPEKFEAGTPNIAGVIASKAAFDFMGSLNFQAIHDYEENLLNLATEKFSQIEGLRIIGTAKKKCSVISFELKDVHPHDLGMLLDQQGIAIRTGHHCTQPLMKRFGVTATARASFTIYNNESDIDSLVNGINKAKELLS